MYRPNIEKASGYYLTGSCNPLWGSATILYHKTFWLDSCDELNEDALEWLTDMLLGECWVEIEAYFNCGFDETAGMKQYAELDEWFIDEEFCKLVDQCPYLDEEGKKAFMDAIERFAEKADGYNPYEN